MEATASRPNIRCALCAAYGCTVGGRDLGEFRGQ